MEGITDDDGTIVPVTLTCEHCTAIWCLVPDVNDEDRAWMRQQHDEHVCDPDTDPAVVAAIRDDVRRLAATLPPDVWGHLTVEEFGPEHPGWDDWLARNAAVEDVTREVVARYGDDLPNLRAAAPHSPGSIFHPTWFEVAKLAWITADRLSRRSGLGDSSR